MISRRSLVLSAATIALVPTSCSARAAPYTAAALAEAQWLGRPVLVEIFAPWCSTCRAQKEVLDVIELEQRYWQVIRLVVDFDDAAADVRQLKATRQGTLIMFKGAVETGRIVGVSRRDAIEALLTAGL
jgi:thioredoxin 1